jgi:hypothetical protein
MENVLKNISKNSAIISILQLKIFGKLQKNSEEMYGLKIKLDVYKIMFG